MKKLLLLLLLLPGCKSTNYVNGVEKKADIVIRTPESNVYLNVVKNLDGHDYIIISTMHGCSIIPVLENTK